MKYGQKYDTILVQSEVMQFFCLKYCKNSKKPEEFYGSQTTQTHYETFQKNQ